MLRIVYIYIYIYIYIYMCVCVCVCVYIYIYIYIKLRKMKPIFCLFHWDISCEEDSGIIQSQVLPCMDSFITRALVNFDENLTH